MIPLARFLLSRRASAARKGRPAASLALPANGRVDRGEAPLSLRSARVLGHDDLLRAPLPRQKRVSPNGCDARSAWLSNREAVWGGARQPRGKPGCRHSRRTESGGRGNKPGVLETCSESPPNARGALDRLILPKGEAFVKCRLYKNIRKRAFYALS